MNSFPVLSESEIRDRVLNAYGEVQVYERAELDDMMAKEGDIKMDSAPAGAIIAKMEAVLGRELPEPSDLHPEEFNSVNNLVALIARKMSEGEGKTLKRVKTAASV